MSDPRRKSLISSRPFCAHPLLTGLGLDSLYAEYIHRLDSAISYLQYSLSTSPRSHPHRLKHLFKLAIARRERHLLSNDKNDLDKSILHLTEVVLLQPYSYLPAPVPDILEALLFLALALLWRSKGLKQPEDAAYAAKYLRHLRDQPHEAFKFPHHRVTTSLVEALAFQVELKPGNVMHTIEEMAMLCRELLTLDTSEGDTTHTITLLARVVGSRISPWDPDQPLDSVIECLREASTCKPDLRAARLALAHSLGCRYFLTYVDDDYEEAVSMALAHSLGCRYFLTYVDDDYEEAVSILDEIIGSNPPEDILVAQALQLVTYLAMIRLLR